MIIDEQADFRSVLMHHVTTFWPDAIISAYDPTVAASATNVDLSANPALEPYGLFSRYTDGITSISGDAAGNTFSANSGEVLVGNSNPGDATFLDGIFAQINIGTGGFDGFSANTARTPAGRAK